MTRGEPSVREAGPAKATEPSGIASIAPRKPFSERSVSTTAGRAARAGPKAE